MPDYQDALREPPHLRLADLLVAISVATDLGMGQPPLKAARSCVVATGLARSMALSEDEVRDVYLATLLRHLGCTATAHDEALLGGDELVSRPIDERSDFGNPREMLAVVASTGRGTGLQRPRHLARVLATGRKGSERIFQAICEVGARLAQRLELGDGVRHALEQVMERWDGKGSPRGLRGEELALPTRMAELATQVVIFDRLGGEEAAQAMVARRADGWFDPVIAEAFRRHGSGLLRELGVSDPWMAALDAEPQPLATIPGPKILNVARAFADMVDLKSPFTLGHASGVADLAESAARSLHLPEPRIAELRLAALLHDVGRVGVSNRIWDKEGPLTTAEREQVRLHPYHTERILMHSSALSPLALVASMHHERPDGSGYHRGSSAPEIPMGAGILASADAYQAMRQERPHRPALSSDEAAALIAEEASAGRLDPECSRAVIDAAGGSAAGGVAWPAGLTDREVEVLRLAARGLSNHEIAKRLFISRRTAEHHVQHVYAKIGTSTRASAAIFAMEHGLLRL